MAGSTALFSAEVPIPRPGSLLKPTREPSSQSKEDPDPLLAGPIFAAHLRRATLHLSLAMQAMNHTTALRIMYAQPPTIALPSGNPWASLIHLEAATRLTYGSWVLHARGLNQFLGRIQSLWTWSDIIPLVLLVSSRQPLAPDAPSDTSGPSTAFPCLSALAAPLAPTATPPTSETLRFMATVGHGRGCTILDPGLKRLAALDQNLGTPIYPAQAGFRATLELFELSTRLLTGSAQAQALAAWALHHPAPDKPSAVSRDEKAGEVPKIPNSNGEDKASPAAADPEAGDAPNPTDSSVEDVATRGEPGPQRGIPNDPPVVDTSTLHSWSSLLCKHMFKAASEEYQPLTGHSAPLDALLGAVALALLRLRLLWSMGPPEEPLAVVSTTRTQCVALLARVFPVVAPPATAAAPSMPSIQLDTRYFRDAHLSAGVAWSSAADMALVQGVPPRVVKAALCQGLVHRILAAAFEPGLGSRLAQAGETPLLVPSQASDSPDAAERGDPDSDLWLEPPAMISLALERLSAAAPVSTAPHKDPSGASKPISQPKASTSDLTLAAQLAIGHTKYARHLLQFPELLGTTRAEVLRHVLGASTALSCEPAHQEEGSMMIRVALRQLLKTIQGSKSPSSPPS